MTARARAWAWRRRWALIALVVIVPASIVVTLSVDWFDYVRLTSSDGARVAPGDTGTYAGVDYTLVDVETIQADSAQGEELGALPGTAVVVARVHVDSTDADPDARSCRLLLIAAGPGGDRVWDTGQSDVYIPSSDDTVGYCTFPDPDDPLEEDPAVFDYEAVFVVPSDAADAAVLRVSDGPFQLRTILQLDR